MSKFAILGTLANAAITAGVAAPMGVNLTKTKRIGGWSRSDGEYLCKEKGSRKVVGNTYEGCDQNSVGEDGYEAVSELVYLLCYNSKYKEETLIKKFCIADEKDNDGDGEIDSDYVVPQ